MLIVTANFRSGRVIVLVTRSLLTRNKVPSADLFKFFSANLLSSRTTASQKMALPVGYLKTRAEHGLIIRVRMLVWVDAQ